MAEDADLGMEIVRWLGLVLRKIDSELEDAARHLLQLREALLDRVRGLKEFARWKERKRPPRTLELLENSQMALHISDKTSMSFTRYMVGRYGIFIPDCPRQYLQSLIPSFSSGHWRRSP